MFLRSNYKKLMTKLKDPDENFKHLFLERHNLQYGAEDLETMKKNTKTGICLLYNVCARSWRDSMLNFIKNKLSVSISLTAPKELHEGNVRFCREPNIFFCYCN